MANERKPSRRQQPDDDEANDPLTDEWDDLLDDPFEEPDLEPESKPTPDPVKPAPEKSVSRPMRSRKEIPAKEKAAKEKAAKEEAAKEKVAPDPEPPLRRRQSRKQAPAPPQDEPEEEFRPETLEGAERTKDGLIKVREGAKKKADNGKPKKESWLKSLGVVDYIGLAASLAIFVGLAGMLLTWMYGEEWGAGLVRPDPVPEVPAVGTLFKVTSIESYWRRRTDDDRASSSELFLPEVTIEVEAVAQNGFLSVLFLEPEGTMSADSGNLTLSGGQISVRENEGRKDGPNRFTFTSTKGYTFEPEFRSYISLEDMKPWSIEIVETTEFGSDESKRLAYFEIARDARTRQERDVATPAAPVAE